MIIIECNNHSGNYRVYSHALLENKHKQLIGIEKDAGNTIFHRVQSTHSEVDLHRICLKMCYGVCLYTKFGPEEAVLLRGGWSAT